MEFRPWFNRIAIFTAVVAFGWQLVNLGLDRLAKTSKPTINAGKLLTDLRSNEYKVVHAAASSIYMLAGVDELRPQLVKAGIHKQLVAQVLSAGLTDTSNELLPIALLTLAKMTKAHPTIAPHVMVPGMTGRMVDVVKTGVPGWMASLSQLMYHLCSADEDVCGTLETEVLSRQEMLVPVAMSLLESGAVTNHTEALVSGCRLMELLISVREVKARHQARDQLLSKGALRILGQTLKAEHHDSQAVAAVAQVLRVLVDDYTPSLGLLADQGILTPLLNEIRASKKSSFSSVLGLLLRLIHHDVMRGDAVSSGLLSLCAQVLFQPASEDAWRIQCVSLLCEVAGEGESHGSHEDLERQPQKQRKQGITCLVAMMNQNNNVPLHGSAVEAMRDLGTSRAACDQMVAQGVLTHLTVLLSGDIPEEHTSARSWLMQTQRGAAALVALISLQPHLRQQVVEAGLIEALAACIRNHVTGPGLKQQLRITAAAALVPILGTTDDTNDVRVVESGVLEHLVPMLLSSTSDQERQVASKVMSILRRQPPVEAMYKDVGLQARLQ